MTPTPSKRALQWHQAHRRENFAASQRLEGIHTPLTRAGNTAPPPDAGRTDREVHGQAQALIRAGDSA